LGVFDGASNEFAQGNPAQPVEVDADGANPAAGWYGTQPATLIVAPSEGLEAMASAPRAIRFAIPDSPAEAYRLHVALLIESRSVPALRICIDGRCGMFYLDSPLDAHMGDSDDTFQSVHAPADVTFDFPGSYLRSGANRITFQVIEESDRVVPGANLTYDAIELDRIRASELPGPSSAAILPTVYFQRQQGSLKELVDVYIRSGERITADSNVDLTIAGSHYHKILRDDQDFGEEMVEFSIPEFSSGTSARLEWKIAGQQYRKEQKIEPQKKWTLFLVPNIHLDVGYSDYQPKVAAIQDRAMDEGMDLAERYPGFSFSVDGSWDLEEFMKTRAPADQQRAIAAM
jgi:hypothetical protein